MSQESVPSLHPSPIRFGRTLGVLACLREAEIRYLDLKLYMFSLEVPPRRPPRARHPVQLPRPLESSSLQSLSPAHQTAQPSPGIFRPSPHCACSSFQPGLGGQRAALTIIQSWSVQTPSNALSKVPAAQPVRAVFFERNRLARRDKESGTSFGGFNHFPQQGSGFDPPHG